MEEQAAAWREVGAALGVKVTAPCEIILSNGEWFRATALVRVGPPQGMVADPDYEVIEPHAATLITDGYGYSAVTLETTFDEAEIIEILQDWGWQGPIAP